MTPGDQPDSVQEGEDAEPEERPILPHGPECNRSAGGKPQRQEQHAKHGAGEICPRNHCCVVPFDRPRPISGLDTRRGGVTQLGSRKTPPRAIRNVQALLFYIVLGVSSVMLGSGATRGDTAATRLTKVAADPRRSKRRSFSTVGQLLGAAAGVTLCGITREETTSWRCSR